MAAPPSAPVSNTSWAQKAQAWITQPANAVAVAAGVGVVAWAGLQYFRAQWRAALAKPDANTWFGAKALAFMMEHHGEEQAAAIASLPGGADLPEGRIAEFGFAHGEGLKLLLAHFPAREALGVDVSISAVKAVSQWPEAAAGRLTATCADLCQGLDLPDGALALSFNMNCVYFWGDLEGGAGELYRVTAAGGRAVTVTHPKHIVSMKTAGGPFKNVELLPVVQAFQKAGFEVTIAYLAADGSTAPGRLEDVEADAKVQRTAIITAHKPQL